MKVLISLSSDGGIAYCKNSVPIEQCVECYHGTELFSPLYSMEMFEELKEELEEGYHGNTDLEHLLEEFEEKCVGPKVRCLTEEQMEGRFFTVFLLCVCVCV